MIKRIIIGLLLLILILAGCAGPGLPEGPDNQATDPSLPTGSGGSGTPSSPETLTFLFFSDTQPDPDLMDHTGVGEYISRVVRLHEGSELVVFGGDTIHNGSDPAEWNDFWNAVGSSLEGLTTAAVAGNHDRHALLAEQFDYPRSAPEKPEEGFFYSFTAGLVYFIMLDSNIMGAANQQDIDWLRSELQGDAARNAAWRIAVSHHPMWPVSDIPNDILRAETMREHFLPILEESGVELLLCGHQHVYSRTSPMSGDAAAYDGRGIVQAMVATGDKASYSLRERDFIIAGYLAPNYIMVTADSASLLVTAFDGEHEAIDQFAIHYSHIIPDDDGDDDGWRIRVVDTAGKELLSFTEAWLARRPPELSGAFAHAYSAVNNWPSPRFYAAEGYRIESILAAAGMLDAAQTVTFRADDGYQVSLTRGQLLGEQYFFPMAGESGGGAVPVSPIIAFRWREGSADLGDLAENKPILIFGQRDPFEQTNPAFVEGVSEIIVDVAPSQSWPMAGTFPMPGPIAGGETVKLQHPSFGLVKLHYTLDGSDPTRLSAMYNPSTYQPELNVPIPISGPTTIKVLVTGYGKNDSEIAAFEFWTTE